MPDDAAVERELFEVGRRLADALPTTRNPLKAIDEKAMDLASSDAELKAALFRFVDVVPACRNLEDLAHHLTSFLDEVGSPPPAVGVPMKMGNSRAGRRALGMAAAAGVRHMAHRFIVGEDPKAALGVLRDLWKNGVARRSPRPRSARPTRRRPPGGARTCPAPPRPRARRPRPAPGRGVLVGGGPAARAGLGRAAAPGQPEREGLGLDA